MPPVPDDRDPPLRLAGRALKSTRHVCAFFNSKQEEHKVLLPFFKEGIERADKVVHIVEAEQRENHLCACQAAGIDVERAEQSGLFEVQSWSEGRLREAQFDAERMNVFFRQWLDEVHREHRRALIMGHMEWPAARVGNHALVRYEARLNFITPEFPDVFICTYDVNRHSGAMLMDILRTHPLVIIGGVLQENPLYVPPAQFLTELEQRSTG